MQRPGTRSRPVKTPSPAMKPRTNSDTSTTMAAVDILNAVSNVVTLNMYRTVPEEITIDGGPQFTAGKTKEFLSSWGVHHRVTSVANPHANCRAEVAVKSAKRMLMDNTGPIGSLIVDKFQKAMLIFRNSIDPETKASPALILFGRPIRLRDPIPTPMGRYCSHNTWTETLAHREKALAKRHAREHEKWSQHTRLLQPLKVGDRDEDASVPSRPTLPAPQPQPLSQVDDILDPPSEAPPSPTRDTNDTSTTPTNPTELLAQALPRALTRLLPHNKPGQNTIDPETKASPALILFGRPIRDPIPIPMGRYCPHTTWTETLAHREKALAKRHAREHEKWSQHTRLLQPLKVGDRVYIQNLIGNHPRKWERTGVVVETRQFHQYVVRIDGSGRVTLRNRQHLRKFTPFQKPTDTVIKELSAPPVHNLPSKDEDASVPSRPTLPAPQPQPPSQVNDILDPPSEAPPSPTRDTNDTSTTPTNPTELPAQALPRALTRLLPHNKPGQSEQQPLGPRRCKQTDRPTNSR
ncbi:hypothetical protein EGW08_023480 [Elysia chlorotica]|uniref:Integrase catalytic domain-containing protein n=1 Tax=Elysia chlorotica TaxID=188477 RepID=A0A3S0Z1M0_ELYCH|nr:hypothetical protein EGW08_023480 [Elysia chlorotica]